MKKILVFLFVAFFIISCNNEKKTYDEVMAIHDEVMPLMDNIMGLKQELKQKAKHLEKDSIADNHEELEKVRSLIAQLDSADKSMMVWMREFHKDYETIAKAELNEYLEKQKQRITAVGLLMHEAIKNAELYFSE